MEDNVNEAVQQFFVANPDIFKAFTSFVASFQDSRSQHEQLGPDGKHARDIQSMFLKLVANSKLVLSDSSNAPQSTVAATKRIVDSQYKVPLELGLPLLWPTDPEDPTATSTAPSHHSTRDGDNRFSGVDSIFEDTELDDLVHRLAVSKDPNFTYWPQLFKTGPPAADAAANTAPHTATTLSVSQAWSYGTIYRVKYPDTTAVGVARERLAKIGLKLPEAVLDMGRLVVTSDSEDNPDGSSWSPSDYTVVVDMQSQGKPVWLLCDTLVISRLRRLNWRDGITVDRNMVRSLFDWHTMDLALLFPHIDDWESNENTWPALHARITKTGMKLGLHLENL